MRLLVLLAFISLFEPCRLDPQPMAAKTRLT